MAHRPCAFDEEGSAKCVCLHVQHVPYLYTRRDTLRAPFVCFCLFALFNARSQMNLPEIPYLCTLIAAAIAEQISTAKEYETIKDFQVYHEPRERIA